MYTLLATRLVLLPSAAFISSLFLYRFAFDTDWLFALRAAGLISLVLAIVSFWIAGRRGLHRKLWPKPTIDKDRRCWLQEIVNEWLKGASAKTSPFLLITVGFTVFSIVSGNLFPRSTLSLPNVAADFVDGNGVIEVAGIPGEAKSFQLTFLNRGRAVLSGARGKNQTVSCFIDEAERIDGRLEARPRLTAASDDDASCTHNSSFLVESLLKLQVDALVEEGEPATFFGTFRVPPEFKVENKAKVIRLYFQIAFGPENERRVADKKVLAIKDAVSQGYVEFKVLPPKTERALKGLETSPATGTIDIPGIPPSGWLDREVFSLSADQHVSGLQPNLDDVFQFQVPQDGIFRLSILEGAWTPGPLLENSQALFSAGGVLVENSRTTERVLLDTTGLLPWRFTSEEEASALASTGELQKAMVLREGDVLSLWLYSPTTMAKPEGGISIKLQQLDLPTIPEVLQPAAFP